MKKILLSLAVLLPAMLYFACTELKDHANPYDPDYAGDTAGGSSSSSSGGGNTGLVVAPLNLYATYTNSGTIVLSWDPVSNADYYKVSRSQDSNTITGTLATPASNVYIDSAVGTGFYYYKVTAHNTTHDSADSTVVSGAIWDAIYVSLSGDDTNIGTIKAPVKNFNQAIALAGTLNTIKSTADVYTPVNGGINSGPTCLPITVPSLVFLGGYSADYSTRSAYTVLDALGSANYVVDLAGNTFMERFVVRGGYHATQNGSGIIANFKDNCLLTNMIVSNNTYTAAGNGGGLYIASCSNFSFFGEVSHNSVGRWGGGIYLYVGKDILVDAIVTSNHAANYGGGLYADWSTGPHNIKGYFQGNSATLYGGGLCFGNPGPNPHYTIIDVVATGNTAGNNGGGILIFTNSWMDIHYSGSSVTGNTPDDISLTNS